MSSEHALDYFTHASSPGYNYSKYVSHCWRGVKQKQIITRHPNTLSVSLTQSQRVCSHRMLSLALLRPQQALIVIASLQVA